MDRYNPTQLRLQKKLQQRKTGLSEIIAEALKLHDIALPLNDAGKHVEALPLFAAAINKLKTATSQQLSLKSNPDVANYHHNYAAILCLIAECHEALGNDSEAEKLFVDAHERDIVARGNLINFYGRKERTHDQYRLLKLCDRKYLVTSCGASLLYNVASYLYHNASTAEERIHTLYYCRLAVEACEKDAKVTSSEQLVIYKKSLAKIYYLQGNFQACYDTYRDLAKISHAFYQELARLVDEYGHKITRPKTETEFFWQKLSYEHDNKDGAFDYAYMLSEGGEGFERDCAKAVEIFKGLAANGYPKALHQLGVLYY